MRNAVDDQLAPLRQAIRRRLADLSAAVKERFAGIVADPPQPEWGVLQFEVDPFSWGIHFVEDGEGVLSDDQTEHFFDAASVCAEAGITDEDFDYYPVLEPLALDWLADCWHEAGGCNVPYPAEAFFHGYHLDRFDFRSRQWSRLA
jgi:hypothetical protein